MGTTRRDGDHTQGLMRSPQQDEALPLQARSASSGRRKRETANAPICFALTKAHHGFKASSARVSHGVQATLILKRFLFCL